MRSRTQALSWYRRLIVAYERGAPTQPHSAYSFTEPVAGQVFPPIPLSQFQSATCCLCFLFQALSNQQKAVLMSERVLGIEHPNTIQEYVSKGGAKCASSGIAKMGLGESIAPQSEGMSAGFLEGYWGC